jgi:ribosomal protein L29
MTQEPNKYLTQIQAPTNNPRLKELEEELANLTAEYLKLKAENARLCSKNPMKDTLITKRI